MAEGGRLRVEVAWATPERQVVVPVEVPEGATVEDAVQISRLLQTCPDAVFDPERVGIFGRRVQPGDAVRDGDRIELYRPLIADPREARRARAERARAEKEREG